MVEQLSFFYHSAQLEIILFYMYKNAQYSYRHPKFDISSLMQQNNSI